MEHSRECYLENHYHKRSSESWYCVCKVNDPYRKYNSYPTYKELELIIQRVRELHKPQEVWMGNYECVECSPSSCGCFSYVEYPCPTIKALDGEW